MMTFSQNHFSAPRNHQEPQACCGLRRRLLGLTAGGMLGGVLLTLAVPAAAAGMSRAMPAVAPQAMTTADAGVPTLSLAESRAASDEMKHGPLAKIGSSLAGLLSEHQVQSLTREAQAFRPNNPTARLEGESVFVSAVASGDTEELVADLEAAGMTEVSSTGRLVGGLLPIASLEAVADLDSLQFMRPTRAITNVGSVTSEAVKALLSQRLIQVLGVRGRGITVGVLSDSFDCLGGANADFNSKDLAPKAKTSILQEGPCSISGDEGRAMMQLIRDVAPAAKQMFHSAFISDADFANGIRELANNGADIIVDDVFYSNEPMFQDGPIAQAVDDVKAQGVVYFSSAGNFWRNAWETDDKGFESAGTNGHSGLQHDFNTGNGKDGRMLFQFNPGRTDLILQWDQPYASASAKASKSDLDINLYIPGSNTFLFGEDSNEIGGDPTVILSVFNGNASAVAADIAIELVNGPAPGFMKMIFLGGPSSFPLEYDTFSGALFGHANAAGAIATAAAAYFDTPKFGVSPPEVEFFSSAGPTPIFFNKNGTRRSSPAIRNKPEITSVDGTITTFFGSGNRFFGTSAAAPHAAAVAALLLEIDPTLTPNQIKSYMMSTAVDMDDPFTNGFDTKFDFATGRGLLNALKAGKKADRLK